MCIFNAIEFGGIWPPVVYLIILRTFHHFLVVHNKEVQWQYISPVVQAIASFEKSIILKNRDKAGEIAPPGGEPDINPKVYCILGHLHLLLGDFPKGKMDCGHCAWKISGCGRKLVTFLMWINKCNHAWNYVSKLVTVFASWGIFLQTYWGPWNWVIG